MTYYNQFQWMFVFFTYCFIGWIWETCYVSIKERFFENRGFMKGPFLPIYGFGACIMLVSSMYVRDYPVLVFLFGLISATVMELATGILMEKLFKVKYWTYAHEKFNYKGYICVKSSLTWGVASLLLAYLLHKPIDALVMSIPEKILQNIVIVITIVAAMDFATSFKAALDLRDILVAVDRIKVELSRLQRRGEIIETFITEGAAQKTQELQAQFQEVIGSLANSKDAAMAELSKIKELQQTASDSLKSMFTENKSVTSLLRRNSQVVSKEYDDTLNAYKEKFINTVKGVFSKDEKDV